MGTGWRGERTAARSGKSEEKEKSSILHSQPRRLWAVGLLGHERKEEVEETEEGVGRGARRGRTWRHRG